MVARASSQIQQRHTTNNQQVIKTSNSCILDFLWLAGKDKIEAKGKGCQAAAKIEPSAICLDGEITRTGFCYFFFSSLLPRDNGSIAGGRLKENMWFLSLIFICLCLGLTNNYLTLFWLQGKKKYIHLLFLSGVLFNYFCTSFFTWPLLSEVEAKKEYCWMEQIDYRKENHLSVKAFSSYSDVLHKILWK